jgi:hypothetical protein
MTIHDAYTPINQFSSGVPFSLEFQWNATSLTSVDMIVRQGSLSDFSDLTEILSFTDSVSPHITSVAEGLFGYGASGPLNLFVDSTTIYKGI